MADVIKMVMNDATTVRLHSLPYKSIEEVRGMQTDVLCIPFASGITVDQIKGITQNPLKMAKVIFEENSNEVREESDYTTLVAITSKEIPTGAVDEYDEPTYTFIYIAKMRKDATVPEQVAELRKTVKTLQNENQSLKEAQASLGDLKPSIERISNEVFPTYDETTMSLTELKSHRIDMNKESLQRYLHNHPIKSRAHKGIEGVYSITSEKQTMLMAMIMMANSGGDAYQPSWNETGKPCSYDWTVEELTQLAGEIEAVVRPLISAQQTIETTINGCATAEEVRSVEIEFEVFAEGVIAAAAAKHHNLIASVTAAQEAEEYNRLTSEESSETEE